MPLTITITRLTAPVDALSEHYVNAEKDVAVHAVVADRDLDLIDVAVGILSGENWESSTLPITAFICTDWLHVEYLQDDDVAVDVVIAKFSEDWPLGDMHEVIKRVVV